MQGSETNSSEHNLQATTIQPYNKQDLIIVFCNDDHYHCLKEKNYSYQSKYRGYRLQPLK
jgi:hypothetical protein